MKTYALLFAILFIFSLSSCSLFEDDEVSIDGEQSTMGEVGAEIYSYDGVPGVEGASAAVVSLDDGISTYSGKAIITDPTILDIISNIPEFTVKGDTVTVSNLKFKVTKEGIESMNPSYPGILVRYDSEVGDKYPVKDGIEREVISKSTDNDYPWIFFYTKVIKVEESPSLIPGVSKIVYIANHKFGLVGLEVTYDDASNMAFTIDGSATNE